MPSSDSGESRRSIKPQSRPAAPAPEQENLPCPRCDSTNTKFCYYNNYNYSQPRHFCKAFRRYWTHGGTFRDIPVGGGTRKNAKRSRTHHVAVTSPSSSSAVTSAPPSFPHGSVDGEVKQNMSVCGSFTSLLNNNHNPRSQPSSTQPAQPHAKPPKTTHLPPLCDISPPSVSQPPPSHDASPPSVSQSPRTPSTVPPPPTLPSTLTSGPAATPTNETIHGDSPIVPFPSIPSVNGSDNIATNNAPSHSGGLNTGAAVTIGVVVSLIVLSLLGIAVCFVQKKKKRKGSRSDYPAPSPYTSSHNSG